LLFLIFIVVSNHLTLAIVADYSTIPKGTNPTLYDTHDYVVQLDDQSFNETVFCLNSNSNNLFLDENEINNNLTKQSFSSISGETEINGHCTSFIVEFYSDWCGHCRTYSRFYKALANDLLAWKGVLKLAAINCADPVNIDTCRDSSITHYPLLKYFPRNSIENNLNSNITVGQPLRSYQSLAQIRDQITRIILTEYEANRYEDWPKFEWLEEVETYNQLWKDIDSHISTLVVLFEANTDSLVGAQLLLDLSSYADKVVARRCVNNALANALQINDFPTFAVFRRGERYPLHIAELRRLLFNEFEQLLLNNNNKENKKLANKFFSRRKLNNNNNSISENHKLFCENFPQICRRDFFVSELDLLKSARIALFNDVQMIGSDYISGENLTALNDFVEILAKHFPHRTIHPQSMRKNKEIDSLLNSKEEIIGTSSEKENIEFLNASSRARVVFSNLHDFINKYKQKEEPIPIEIWKAEFIKAENNQNNPFPISEEWEHCKGSSPVLRGYTCGLWTLFHVLTVNGYRNGEKEGKFDPLNILFSIRNWVLSFFTCEYCRIHFRKMTTKIAKIESSILRNEDLFLYLWKAHNIVNSRLNGKETEDPKFPKYQFPPKFLCQECRKKGEEDNDLFEEDKIKNFLLLFYSDIRPIGAKSVEDEVEEIEKRLE
ncbi:Sulfhydryl oxidase, partial [Meloidogyne graminicola]